MTDAADPARRNFLLAAGAMGTALAVAPAGSTPASAQEGGSWRVVLRDESGNEIADERFRFDAAANSFWVSDVDVRFGAPGPAAAPDFLYDPANRKLTTRSLLCHEIGDSVDIGGGRAGPDNADRLAEPETTEPSARLVRFWGRSYVTDLRPGTEQPVGWDGGRDGDDFAICGEMAIHADGQQTPQSRPGQLHLRTTRPGEYGPRDGLVVTARQQLCAGIDGEPERPVFTFASDRGTGLSRFKVEDGRIFLNASVDGARVADFRRPRQNRTALALAYVTEEGEVKFEAVEVGEPDSAGPGYRALRIPN